MSTISTILSRLADKGVVTHRTHGRGFVYRPAISQQEVRRSLVADIIDKVFGGDRQALVSHLLRGSEISSEELDELQRMIEQIDEETDDRGALRCPTPKPSGP